MVERAEFLIAIGISSERLHSDEADIEALSQVVTSRLSVVCLPIHLRDLTLMS